MKLSEAELKALPYYNRTQKVITFRRDWKTGKWNQLGYGCKVTPRLMIEEYVENITSREQA